MGFRKRRCDYCGEPIRWTQEVEWIGRRCMHAHCAPEQRLCREMNDIIEEYAERAADIINR